MTLEEIGTERFMRQHSQEVNTGGKEEIDPSRPRPMPLGFGKGFVACSNQSHTISPSPPCFSIRQNSSVNTGT
jgi:hypothetical protein